MTLRKDLQEQQPPEHELLQVLQVFPALTAVSLTPLPSSVAANIPHSGLINLFHTCFPVYSLATGTSSLSSSCSCSLARLVSARPSRRTISMSSRNAPLTCTCEQRTGEFTGRDLGLC